MTEVEGGLLHTVDRLQAVRVYDVDDTSSFVVGWSEWRCGLCASELCSSVSFDRLLIDIGHGCLC
jgi:hypothetical protein